jgi:hypothetical protein
MVDLNSIHPWRGTVKREILGWLLPRIMYLPSREDYLHDENVAIPYS